MEAIWGSGKELLSWAVRVVLVPQSAVPLSLFLQELKGGKTYSKVSGAAGLSGRGQVGEGSAQNSRPHLRIPHPKETFRGAERVGSLPCTQLT